MICWQKTVCSTTKDVSADAAHNLCHSFPHNPNKNFVLRMSKIRKHRQQAPDLPEVYRDKSKQNSESKGLP